MVERLTAAVVIVGLLLAAPPAGAHSLKMFAAVADGTITGVVYLSGGHRVAGVTVRAEGPNGEPLGEATTAEDGTFRLEVGRSVDHLLVADTGDGHRATLLVRASELATASAEPTSSAHAAEPPADTGPRRLDDLDQRIAAAVGTQVRPLREQLTAFEDRVLWRDVLGGLGYLMGLAGLAFYMLGHRHGQPRKPSTHRAD